VAINKIYPANRVTFLNDRKLKASNTITTDNVNQPSNHLKKKYSYNVQLMDL